MSDISDIIEWASKQSAWVGDALRRHALSSGFVLSDNDKEHIKQRVRHAAGFIVDPPPDHTPISEMKLTSQDSDEPRALLCSLGPVEHMGRLAKGQRLSFALDGITLIYGDNGSGKSGYCRITKKLCRSATRDSLLGNVFEDGDKPPARAVVRFKPKDGEPPVEKLWIDGSPTPPEIRNISVFDTSNARFYIDQRNRIAFLPTNIAILESHGAHRSEMDAEFSAERKALDDQLKVPLPGGYSPGGLVATTIIAALQPGKALPTADTITKLGTLCEEEKSELNALQMALAQDPAALAERYKRCVTALTSSVETLKHIEIALADTVINDLKVKVDAAAATATAADIDADALFSTEALPGVGKDPWKLMFQYAKDYIIANGLGEDLPHNEGDLCALCQQPLNTQASARLQRFKEFISGEANKRAAAAKKELEEKLRTLHELTLPSPALIEQSLAEYSGISHEETSAKPA